MDANLIDRIYEAAVVPSLWTGRGVLDLLAKVGDCTDAAFFAVDKNGISGWTANEPCFQKMEIYVRENWVASNPYLETPERRARFDEPRFLLDTEVLSVEQMRQSRYYQEFMRPQGVYWHAGTSITSPAGDIIKLSVHRKYDDGPLSPDVANRLTALRPHLARSSLLTARLRFEQVRGAVEAFNMIGLPTAALSRGRLIFSNQGFEKLVPDVVQDRRLRLTFTQTTADVSWHNLLETSFGHGGTFPIAATAERCAMIVHVLPIVGASRDIFAIADMLLIITSAEEDTAIDPKILEGLFDLTVAEASVAREITRGKTLRDIAKIRGVAIDTVRGQLRLVFDKTGVHRQVDLVRLLSGMRTGSTLLVRLENLPMFGSQSES
ncbi:helix-turn-helix transcriptional regulator [Mesorhizobium kowhaii]|uniref:helix-turn-helix transcriptional regulator n=1 Tax=Mesorhizobium kowhaii TaxID=1300272 RepID=UPI0035E81249